MAKHDTKLYVPSTISCCWFIHIRSCVVIKPFVGHYPTSGKTRNRGALYNLSV
ncbi:hypothetical protein Hanom_Chr14g01316891 [Helianthus anomalus]